MNMDLRLSKSFNPVRQTSLISPVRLQDIPAQKIHQLYVEDQLTEYEFQILEFIGMTNVIKGGSSLMSFQGMKRLLDIHQAKLTKALNRLHQKELLEKEKAGYKLSDEGAELFNKLYEKLNLVDNRIPDVLYTHVIRGRIDGFYSNHSEMRKIISEGLLGRWFGQYRFTAKIEYEGMVEICWISTEDKTSISFLLGPDNEISIAHSSTRYMDVETELQILSDRISNAVEDIIDIPIEINSYQIYENNEIMH